MKAIILKKYHNIDYKTGIINGFVRKRFMKISEWGYKYQFDMDMWVLR